MDLARSAVNAGSLKKTERSFRESVAEYADIFAAEHAVRPPRAAGYRLGFETFVRQYWQRLDDQDHADKQNAGAHESGLVVSSA